MGFVVTSLIFTVIGILASLCTRVFCNSGPSTNFYNASRASTVQLLVAGVAFSVLGGIFLLLVTLVITATVCCWMMWAIVYLAQMKPLIVPILTDGE